ncbi:MAG: alpha/beta hydrolase [Oceanospirillaceae bacterium]|jgi:predicted alpha/beta hydrolase|nr:alpha/beta hydrolase [Oceanospirillaceae bacterium]MBT6076647.1 alpha/beta hydrolase [Oceanospirillaceae bacterium]
MMYHENEINIYSDDGVRLSLWKIEPISTNSDTNVFLTHGAFSNKDICFGIAKYLAERNITCWILEWRSHGSSENYAKSFDFETIALYDMKAAFDYLIHNVKLKSFHCVTHSGGGISLTILLCKMQNYKDNINKIVFFSCQSYGASYSIYSRLKLHISNFVSYLIGYTPGRLLGLGPHNEDYCIMKQWFKWNLTGKFLDKKSNDYKHLMKGVKSEILSIRGENDTFIAPKQGCDRFLADFGSKNKQLKSCGLSTGYLQNYNHSTIFLSLCAKKEIWPLVYEWLDCKGTSMSR